MKQNETTKQRDLTSLRFYTEWSSADNEYAGCCVEFPSLSHLAATRAAALAGITALVSSLMEETDDDR